MTEIDDILVVGAGPAGVSAALALVEQGRPVRLIDAGERNIELPPEGTYSQLKFADPEQWRWQLGRQFEALRGAGATSPKLRVPGFQPMFREYASANHLHAENFQLVGALAGGGLSNAWGCGVARFSAAELGPLAAQASALDASIARVARRMGLSGASEDALSEYLGLDGFCDPALPLDSVHAALWRRRTRIGSESGFRLGRARLAVLASARDGREPCDLRGMCLWGCRRRATWSAVLDLDRLRRSPLAKVEGGVVVQAIARNADGTWTVKALVGGQQATHYVARRILLGAGTVASTRIALGALVNPPAQLRLQSNPMAAFLLCLPHVLGKRATPSFGLAQLSYALDNIGGASAFGNLFSTAGLPVSEFLPYLPVTRRAGLPLLRALLPACMVGNVFLPGALSAHTARLCGQELVVTGGTAADLPAVHAEVSSRLRRAFRRLGAAMLPGSYVPGAPGADLHYASTLPISHHPREHECTLAGEIAGLPGVYAIDGASLPMLPAKAHTLTIMANADRIARGLP